MSQISRLDQVDEQRIRKKQKLFKSAWEEINMTATKKLQRPTSTHAIVKANLNYYLEPAFLQGVMIRTNSIVDSGEIIEASNYLKSIFLHLIENYVMLKSSGEQTVKADFTMLVRSFRNLEEKNPKSYSQILDLLDLDNIGRTEAVEATAKARKIALRIRKDRKVLITNNLIKG